MSIRGRGEGPRDTLLGYWVLECRGQAGVVGIPITRTTAHDVVEFHCLTYPTNQLAKQNDITSEPECTIRAEPHLSFP